MASPSFSLARLVRPALALGIGAALFLPGCGGAYGCKLHCGGDPLFVKLPITDSDALTATTSPTCTAQRAREGNNELGVLVSAKNAGTCLVLVEVSNGDSYTFSIDFQTRDCACGGTVINAVDASAPQLISTGDGGTG